MNFRILQPQVLCDFADNIVNLLGGTDLSSIDSHVRAELITMIGTLPADVADTSAEVLVADDAKRSKVAPRNEKIGSLSNAIARVRDTLKANSAPKSQFELAGFDYPSTTNATYIAQDPSKLSVTGFSNGVVKGTFAGNNLKGYVIYDIWRRQGDEAPWMHHMMTRKQTFTDKGVTPGQYYEYRVRAVAASNTSNFSNSAVVYGIL